MSAKRALTPRDRATYSFIVTMGTTSDKGITRELAKARFTDEMLAEMRALIGTELRTEACLNNEYATRLAILRFCEGIGDEIEQR